MRCLSEKCKWERRGLCLIGTDIMLNSDGACTKYHVADIDVFERKVFSWVDVERHSPPHNMPILVYRGKCTRMSIEVYEGNGKWRGKEPIGSQAITQTITHWMPMPEPPKEAKG